MTLVDSSVWIEYLRRTGSSTDTELTRLQEIDPESVFTTQPVVMELLMGSTDELAVRRLERVLESFDTLEVDAELDFRSAAEIFRAVRRRGRSVRKPIDCLIAAIAIRHDVTLLHKDADFEAIAEVTNLNHRSLRE